MSADNMSDGADAKRKLYMGGEDSQMNLAKLLETSDSLWHELETLRKELESNAAGKNFRQVLTQLDVAGRMFSQLQKELRPQLQFYVAHPMYIAPHEAPMVTEQLSNMPVPEMRESDAQLLEGLPDATHAPHAREAKLREIASVPVRHNKSIAENSMSSQVLHEKSALQKQIRGARTAIQQHVVQLLRERLATHQSVSHGAAPADLGLDPTARQVLTALKKGII